MIGTGKAINLDNAPPEVSLADYTGRKLTDQFFG